MDTLPRLIGDVPRVYLDVERIHPFFLSGARGCGGCLSYM